MEEAHKDDLEPGMGRSPGFFVRQRETVGVGLELGSNSFCLKGSKDSRRSCRDLGLWRVREETGKEQEGA